MPRHRTPSHAALGGLIFCRCSAPLASPRPSSQRPVMEPAHSSPEMLAPKLFVGQIPRFMTEQQVLCLHALPVLRSEPFSPARPSRRSPCTRRARGPCCTRYAACFLQRCHCCAVALRGRKPRILRRTFCIPCLRTQLLPLFQQFGEIKDISVLRDRFSGESRGVCRADELAAAPAHSRRSPALACAGCAFLTYSDKSEADLAIANLHNKYQFPGVCCGAVVLRAAHAAHTHLTHRRAPDAEPTAGEVRGRRQVWYVARGA